VSTHTAAIAASHSAKLDDRLARLAGLLYLLLLPTAGSGFLVGGLIVDGDAAATFARVQAERGGLQLGIILGVVGFVFWLVIAQLLRRLFSVVSRDVGSLMVMFVVAGVCLFLAGSARHMDVLWMLNDSSNSSLRQDHVLLAMQSARNLTQLSFIFSGLWLLPFGWLAFRCGFIPRAFGVLLLFGAPFYGMAFLGPVLDPHYAGSMAEKIVGVVFGIPSVIGELGTGLWLLIKGVGKVQ
jgi:hypothetical protein